MGGRGGEELEERMRKGEGVDAGRRAKRVGRRKRAVEGRRALRKEGKADLALKTYIFRPRAEGAHKILDPCAPAPPDRRF